MTTPAPGQLITLPRDQTVDPFSKVTLRHEPDGRIWIRAYILMEKAKTAEGARTGIAIDGSGTMMAWFGGQRKGAPNIVSPFVQQMCAYLARFDATGRTTAIYWATGDDGRAIEEIGTLTVNEAARHDFAGPRHYGTHTCLLPALRYFVSHFPSAVWGLYVFITDGRLDDLDAVKAYTTQLAREIDAGQRKDLKLIMIGVGRRIDEAQMAALDDLDTGTRFDLWDHKIADNMQHLAEIFSEVVDEQVIVAPQGRVLDSGGNVIKDYRDTGVRAVLEFVLPSGCTAFTLEIGDNAIVQRIV